jgi:energy-coupling factor transporter ATP-binding protein EcfA2
MTLRDELFAWLVELPAWQQDLARRLTLTTQLEGETLDDARRIVYAAHSALAEGEDAPAPTAIALDDLPGPTDPDDTTRLVCVGNLRGVGVVEDDQEIVFAEEGLTVIYGPNAVGKSSYVGALKRVCRTVDCDSGVRGNVFDAQAGQRPTARVEYIRGGVRRAQQVDLNAVPDTGLDALSVFDARCAELYLNSRNAVAYVPSSLVVLARLAAAQDALRRGIDAEVAALERKKPAFPELDPESAAYSRVAALTAEANLEELRAFTELSEDDRTRMEELRAALATAAARNAQADAEAARQEAMRARTSIGRLSELAGYVADAEATRIHGEVLELAAARQAVAEAAAEFGVPGLVGVGGSAWQRMWQAAREFVQAGGGPFPPAAGDTCPICTQPLDDAAAERLQHFERHVQGALQQRAVEAERSLEASLARVDPIQLEALDAVFSDAVAERERDLAQAVTALREAIKQRMVALHAHALTATSVQLPAIPSQAVEQWAVDREDHAATLLAAADPATELTLGQELAELDGKARLGAQFEAVTLWIATLRRVGALRAAHGALATNRVTSKQRELSTTAVTGALATALTEELGRLNCNHLPVDVEPHTAVGETQVALRLAGAQGVPRVSDILSEGEQRAVSLAFFFAETRLAEHLGGVIVDDPVSSLDDERRAYIARRLTEEASKRQVIVLTHDLPFLLDLLEQAENAELEPKLQGIWRLGSSVGRIDQKPPFTTMRFKERVGDLGQRVEQWDAQPEPRDADDAWHRVCSFYADMRATWERAVEERLFRGVVQRFQREVKTLKLPTVKVTDELVNSIDAGMTRCSYFVHDAPPGTRTTLPGRVQLAADVEKLRDFERATRGS